MRFPTRRCGGWPNTRTTRCTCCGRSGPHRPALRHRGDQPEREYLLVTEFFTGAVEIGEAAVNDAVIDQGLALIRRLWDAGIAHRDIKPGNLMVRDGQLLLIDVCFVQVRPSPWRQAVDLGNMMLVLALRSDPQRVYRRALAYFTPGELAEAFAATRGVASPTL